MPFRILVVDDDQDVRDVLTRFLRRRGYVVDHASDGLEALESVRSKEPDLMLLDIFLPKMTGLSVLSELQSEGCRTPTIALSGMPDDEMIRSSRELGAVAFMPKPFDFPTLTTQIDAYLMAAVDAVDAA